MNRLIIFFGGVMFFTSCRPFVGYSCHPVGYVFQPQMQALVDSFVYLHPSTYVELHVNKVCGVRVWLAVLYAGESPLSSIPACAYAQTSDGTCVAVYSGLEDVCVMKDTLQEVDEALGQSQPASATLGNIFEETFSGGMKIEFFLGPGIDFLSNLGNFPLRNGADVRSFGDILPD